MSLPPNLLQAPKLTFKIGGTDYESFLTSLHVIIPWGGKSSFKGTLVDIFTTPSSSTIQQIRPYPTFLVDGSLNHFAYPPATAPTIPPAANPPTTAPNAADMVEVNIDILGVSSDWPTYLKTSPSLPDGSEVNISGEDFTALLELKNQNMDNITTTRSPQSAQTAIAFMAGTYGINKVTFNWPDYTVRELQRVNGIPRNWIDMCGRPYQTATYFHGAAMYMSSLGSTIGTSPGVLNPPDSKKWTFTDYKILEKLDLTFAEPPKNQFTISRTVHNNILGEANCSGGQCVGRTLNVSFSAPATYIIPHINKVLQGTMINFVYFDVNGIPINATSPVAGPASSVTPIASVQATYQPTFSQAGGGTFGAPGGYVIGGQGNYGYDVTFTGAGDSNPADTTFTLTANDTVAQGVYGLIPEYTPIADPVIPNSTVGQDYVNCITSESTRKTYFIKVSIPYVNPLIFPGDTAFLTDEQIHQTFVQWFVEQVEFIMDNRDDWHMEVTLTRGPTLS